MTTLEIMKRAKAASKHVASASTKVKNGALREMARALVEDKDVILEANKKDLAAAEGKISDVMIDRLMLNGDRIVAMAKGIEEAAALPDPVGRVLYSDTLENGLKIEKVSVALGVVAIIYESRPNVTSDAAALAVKSGNACILRSGKEAHNSAAAITDAIGKGLERAGLPRDTVLLVEDVSRASATELMKGVGYIDLLIPRGGAGLIKSCLENADVPCIETGTGICHIYVDKDADLKKAVKVVENAKTSRPSVCNAMEVCLVHKDVAERFVPLLDEVLFEKREKAGEIPVEMRMDRTALSLSRHGIPAAEGDFDREFLDYKMAVTVVDSAEAAVEHIFAHSTGHSDAIITENEDTARYFTANVDSAAVYVNASTRFTDGGVFGLGCEMGISTQKLHARGPMGLEELNSYKYVIHGDGSIR